VAIRVIPAGPPDPAAWFAATYGREPDGVWFAPGRVNLMGGPDYTEGFVLPFALGAGVTAIVQGVGTMEYDKAGLRLDACT